MTNLQAASLFHFYMVLVIIASVLYLPRIAYYFYGFRKQKHLVNRIKNRLAVIIPARNESAGISFLLDSFSRQTYDHSKFDMFVIVDSEEDPTCTIAAEYPHTYIHVVKNQTCKGMALDGSLKRLLAGAYGKYDAYVIVDADNIVADDFMEEMNNALAADCQIVLGKRDIKNWLLGGKEYRSLATNCNALTYTFIDKMGNVFRTLHHIPCTMCGTGVMIRSDVITEIGGWPYRSLTEDLEMTINCILHKWTSCFYEYAVTYTEEALTHKTSDMRRKRWCIGYMQISFKYRRQIVRQTYESLHDTSVSLLQRLKNIRLQNFDYLYSFFPLFLYFGSVIVCFLIYMSAFLGGIAVQGIVNLTCLKYAGIIALSLYAVLAAFTLIGLSIDRSEIRISLPEKIAVLLYNPFFMSQYAYFYVRAFFILIRNPAGVESDAWQPVERIEQVVKGL
jgi:cellulose synthase/poly-beta-1,6-N-acetylglucosamine synthase-like glycosyltransferase